MKRSCRQPLRSKPLHPIDFISGPIDDIVRPGTKQLIRSRDYWVGERLLARGAAREAEVPTATEFGAIRGGTDTPPGRSVPHVRGRTQETGTADATREPTEAAAQYAREGATFADGTRKRVVGPHLKPIRHNVVQVSSAGVSPLLHLHSRNHHASFVGFIRCARAKCMSQSSSIPSAAPRHRLCGLRGLRLRLFALQ